MKYSLDDMIRIEELLMYSSEDVQIDKYSLDTEFTKQAVLYNRYAAAQSDLEEEKNLLRAMLDKETRQNYSMNNKKAPSEAFVKSTIESNKKYIKLIYYLTRLEGILKALEHKKRSLEKLAELSISGYYAEPKRHKC